MRVPLKFISLSNHFSFPYLTKSGYTLMESQQVQQEQADFCHACISVCLIEAGLMIGFYKTVLLEKPAYKR